MISRRVLLAAGACRLPGAGAAAPGERRNVVVFQEPARYGGWPANHGIWAWGNEIVAGFTAAWYKPVESGHAIDRDRPSDDWQARSLDAGETWTVEKPFAAPAPPRALREPLDFTAPGFALMFRPGNIQVGPSRFFVSTDRCRAWSGPFSFAVEGIDRIATRTDYHVYGKRECLMFGSAAKQNNREGRVFCARTTDGGLTWKLVSRIGPEPAGYMIMPATVRLGQSGLLTAIRHKDPDKPGSIDLYRSSDGGRSWSAAGVIGDLGGGNPPAMVKLQDGRISLTYGYRAQPWGVRTRISADQGRGWSDEFVLRDDALNGDLGYPRAVQRPDGRMLAVYYFNGPRDQDRTIQGTIWQP